MSSTNTIHLWAASELIDFLKMLSLEKSCLKSVDLFIKIEFHPQFWVL